MFRKFIILILIIFKTFPISAQTAENRDDRLSILFIGDIMGHDEQIWSAENRETHAYNYDDVFQYIKDEISAADITIANFEVTLAGPPLSGYPTFSSPAELASACTRAGIDYLVTANNHAADRGIRGITATIEKLDSMGIPHTGTFSSQESRESLYPLLIEKKGKRVALLNYTYGTNGIIVPPPVIVNMLDKALVTADIEKAKTLHPDAIILFLHWGNEYDTIPSKSQTELAEYFFKQGVNLVIGSHPHVLQKMELTKDASGDGVDLVVYSLGNFVSNQRRPKTDGGSMVRIDLEKKDNKLIISDAGYYLTWVYTPIEKYRKEFFILPCSKYENRPEFFSKPSEYQQMKTFIKESRSLLNNQNKNVKEVIFSGDKWLF